MKKKIQIKISKVEYEKARRDRIRLEKLKPAIKKAREGIREADKIVSQIN